MRLAASLRDAVVHAMVTLAGNLILTAYSATYRVFYLRRCNRYNNNRASNCTDQEIRIKLEYSSANADTVSMTLESNLDWVRVIPCSQCRGVKVDRGGSVNVSLEGC